MNQEMINLGRRAAACCRKYPGQKWLFQDGDDGDLIMMERIDENYWTLESEGFSPEGFRGFDDFEGEEGWLDLTDPGTIGILRFFVREAWGKSSIDTMDLQGYDGIGWVICPGEHDDNDKWKGCFFGETEGEVLVEALENAPNKDIES